MKLALHRKNVSSPGKGGSVPGLIIFGWFFLATSPRSCVESWDALKDKDKEEMAIQNGFGKYGNRKYSNRGCILQRKSKH